MPNRYIEIPSPVTVLDPHTNQPMPNAGDGKPVTWDFDFVMQRLFTNPTWGESFAAMRSQEALHDAWKNAKDGVMVVAEEDWVRLKQAIETPKAIVDASDGTKQMAVGFGVFPPLARFLVPLLSAIVDAKAERPKAKTPPAADAS